MIKKSFVEYVSLFLLLTYVLQFIFYYLGFYNGVWKSSNDYLLLWVQLFSLFVLSILFYRNNPIDVLFDGLYRLTRPVVKFLIARKWVVIYVSLILSIYFLLNNLNSYRYGSERLSESVNFPLLALTFLKAATYTYVYIDFDLKKLNLNNSFLSLPQKIIIIIIQLMSLTGLTSGLMLVFSIYLLFAFNPSRKNSNLKSFFKYFSVLFILGFLFIISYAIKWKVGFEEALLIIKTMDFEEYANYLVARLSVSYYALMNYSNLNLNYYDFIDNTLISPRNLIFRFDSLIGGAFDVPKPAFSSINRLNYVLLNNVYVDDRSGTSPGILASFFYQFGSFFGVIFASSYISYVFKLFDSERKSSLLKLCALILFFQGIFKAPFQAFLVFDTNFLSLIIFIYYFKNLNKITKIESFQKNISNNLKLFKNL